MFRKLFVKTAAIDVIYIAAAMAKTVAANRQKLIDGFSDFTHEKSLTIHDELPGS